MKLVVTLDRDETGMIVVECPSIPGCISQGKTEAEALANIREAIQACMEGRATTGRVSAFRNTGISRPGRCAR